MKDGFIKVGAASPALKVANTIYNSESIIETVFRAASVGVKLLVLPELCITGYTCGDLFLQTVLLNAAEDAVFTIAEATKELDILFLVGTPIRCKAKLYNCAVAIYRGEILAVVPKQNMPNYDEFYELRHFSLPTDMQTVTLRKKDYPFGRNILLTCEEFPEFCVGIEICEDLWVPASPSNALAEGGASIIANLSAGDEILGKAEYRRSLVSAQSARLLCGYIYASAGSGESTTDMVFAGHNMIYENGTMLCECPPFESKMIITEIDVSGLCHDRCRMNTFNANDCGRRVHFNMPVTDTVLTRNVAQNPFIPQDDVSLRTRAQEMLSIAAHGLKKRLEHIGAESALVGISGGLDSALALLVSVTASDLMVKPRTYIHAVTMPCFGTTTRTRINAQELCECLGVTFHCIDITQSVKRHMVDIGHDESILNSTYENAQARMRTMVLMNLANEYNGGVIGTGDLSELALGWATYNGDHMSMYGVNASIPKTLVRHIVNYYADACGNTRLSQVLHAILDTPISPELLPAKDGEISQVTEDVVGPYELHDFFIYYALRCGFAPSKIYRLAKYAFNGKYADALIKQWLKTFFNRFFNQQFKRSCMPDGAKVGAVCLSPRGDFRMPSDADCAAWQAELEKL